MLDARQIPMPFSSRPRFPLPFSFETRSMPPVSSLFSSSHIHGSLLHCSAYFAPQHFTLSRSHPQAPGLFAGRTCSYVSEIRYRDSLRPMSRPPLARPKSLSP
ncbi:hypothetical protein FA13DRAFT_1175232 [Coprinellus micaceus]|uniref:Uncharacterized protein n=1 Tax=Coprinellus micaceus TaxID=71717 RepID=A0A4Y7STP2_COPMI|nr:hypothetical protein FA13DRAFT_1175232 [Coprinellus micaceus]